MKFIESESVELKRVLNETIEKEIVAFLNSNNGTIYIGVEDDGKICGVDFVDATLKKISDILLTNILPNPQELITLGTEYIENKQIIKIDIKKGNTLYYIKKFGRSATGCYIRVGSTCRSMTEQQIENRFIDSLKNAKISLNEIISPRQDLTFNDFKMILQSKKVYFSDKTLDINFNFKTIDNKYNYLAYLISDQNDTSIKVCRFKGFTKADFISRKEFDEGCLLKKMLLAKEYVENVINLVQTDIKNGNDRVDVPLFDLESFKEAWFNAVCHNDWTTKTPPAIYAFNDRIEIISHGTLRNDLTLDEFYKGVSKPVNADLAKIFLKLHFMEQSGKGVTTVIKKYGKNVYNFGSSFIECIIPYNIINKSNFDILIGDNLSLDVENENNSTNNSMVNFNDKMIEVDNLEDQIVKLILNKPSITKEELALTTKKSLSTIKRIIKKSSKIEYVGSAKKGNWVITNNT